MTSIYDDDLHPDFYRCLAELVGEQQRERRCAKSWVLARHVRFYQLHEWVLYGRSSRVSNGSILVEELVLNVFRFLWIVMIPRSGKNLHQSLLDAVMRSVLYDGGNSRF